MSRGGYEMTSSEGGVCLINGIAQCPPDTAHERDAADRVQPV